MLSIWTYIDYRKFLRDFYEQAKLKNTGFSYQLFSERAGVTSRGFLYNVIRGARNLPKAAVIGLAQVMKLDKYEREYLENLVAFNQSKSLKEGNYFFEKLSATKCKNDAGCKPQVVRSEQFEYYSKLHHSIIRSLIEMHGFKGDFEWLARAVRPRLTPKQAQKSVQLLENLGLIKKQKDRTYKVLDRSIATPAEVISLAVQNFHKEAGARALDAIDRLPRDARNMTAMTLGISKATYKTICEQIQAMRSKILRLAEADQNADTVYQLNFQIFPLSDTHSERKSS